MKNKLDIATSTLHLQVDSNKAPEVNSEERKISFVACKEQPIIRYDWFKGEKYYLILSHDPKHVNLDRVTNKQCMFLKGHSDSWSDPDLLGVVDSAKLSNGQLLTDHIIGADSVADQYWKNVEAKVVPGVSIEAQINKVEVVEKAQYKEEERDGYTRKTLVKPATLKAVDWELLAISSVHTPAIVGATRRLSQEKETPKNLTVHFNSDPGYLDLESLETEEPTMTGNDIKSEGNDFSTKLADENRTLKLQNSQLEKDLAAKNDEILKLTQVSKYWELRSVALQSYAINNQLTEDEYSANFSEDATIDLEKFASQNPEDTKLDLYFLQRTLQNVKHRKPIDRLSNEKDKAIASNTKLESNTDEPIAPRGDKETFNGQDPKEAADNIISNLFK